MDTPIQGSQAETIIAEAGEYHIELIEDRPLRGMWHCGPNAAWVTITHLPTMISARAFDQYHHAAKQAAMACCQMMVEQSRLLKCQFPERLTSVWSPIDQAPRDGTDILLLLSSVLGHNMIVAAWDETATDEWAWVTLDGSAYHDAAAAAWMALPAPVDGHPQGEDPLGASFMTSAVPEGEAP